MQLDSSLTLSSSSSSLQTSPRSHPVLIPGLPDKLTPKAPVPVRPQALLSPFSSRAEGPLSVGLHKLERDLFGCPLEGSCWRRSSAGFTESMDLV